jgi:hypothetical protein
MKISVMLDKESLDILSIVLGQGGHEYEAVKSLKDMTTKYLLISNNKLSFLRYWFIRWSGITYIVVKDSPSVVSRLSRWFYLHAVGEIAYPTKSTEIDKCIRAMIISSYKNKKKDARTK